MATGSTRDVKLTLSVESLGQDNVNKLEKALRDLAAAGGESSSQFSDLADQINRLGEQNAALQAFKALSAQSEELAQRQQDTADKAEIARAALTQLTEASDKARAAQEAARIELTAGEQAYIASGNAIRTLKVEYDNAGKQTSEYRTKLQQLVAEQNEARLALVGLRDANRDAAAQASAAASEQSKAETAYSRSATALDKVTAAADKQTIALRQARDAADAMGVDTENVVAAEASLVSTFANSVRALEERKAAIVDMAESDRLIATQEKAWEEQLRRGAAALNAENEAIIEAERVTREYAQAKAQAASDAQAWQREADAIVDRMEAERRAQAVTRETIQQLEEIASLNSFRKQADEAQRMVQAAGYVRFWEQALAEADAKQQELATHTAQVNDAFKTLNIRPIEQVQEEIQRASAAMRTLAESGRLTGAELAVAMRQGEAQIAALEREARELSGTLTLSDKAASLFKNSMGQIAAGNVIADGIGYIVQKVKDLGSAFLEAIVTQDKMSRGLRAIYKDADVAASQLQFLRNTALAAGVSVGDLGPAFVQFSASMRTANIPLEQTNALFGAVTRAAGTLGLSGEEVSGMLQALSQMAGKGTVAMEELRQQLGDRLPGALGLVAQGMGITEAQLIKLVESGNLAARDMIPALTKGLAGVTGETEGLNVTWGSFKTVLTSIAQDVGDAGWTAILIGALKILGGLVVATVNGLSFLWEALRLTGVAAIALAETLRGNGKEAWGYFNEQVKVSTDRLTAQADRFNAMLDPASESAQRVRDAAKASETQAAAAQKSGSATQGATAALAEQGKVSASVAKSLEYSAEVNKILENSTLSLSDKIIQINVLTSNRLPLLEKEATASDKMVKAINIHGEALVTLARIRGSEIESSDAEVEATKANLAALEKSSAAHRAVSETLQLQRQAVYDLAQQETTGVAGRQQELLELDKKITTQKAETEQSAAAVEQMKNELVQRKMHSQALQDNADRLAEYRAAAVQAEAALATLRVELSQGRATQEQVTEAERNAAVATGLYRDALNDTISRIQAKNQLEQANINVKTAGLSVQQQAYEQLVKEYEAIGDSNMATYYQIQAKETQIKITQLQAEAKKKESEATILATKAEMKELEETGALTETKRLEMEARLANAKAKAIEADASAIAIKALNAEIQAIRNKADHNTSGAAAQKDANSATKAGTQAATDHAEALTKEAGAVQKLTEDEANLQRGRTKDGWGVNTQGQKVTAGSDVATLTGIANFLKSAGLDEATARQVALEFSDGKGAIPFINNPGQMKYGGAYSSMSDALLKAAEKYTFSGPKVGGAASAGTSSTSSTASASSASSASSTAAASSSTPVIINVGGKQTKVNVASSADASALAALIQQLEHQGSTAS